MVHHFDIPDITCAQCADIIAKAVKGVDERADCKVDVEGKRMQLTTGMPPSDFIEALEEVGYSSFLAQV